MSALSLYLFWGMLINLSTWGRGDDAYFKAKPAVAHAYLLSSFFIWPIFLAIRAGRLLARRAEETICHQEATPWT